MEYHRGERDIRKEAEARCFLGQSRSEEKDSPILFSFVSCWRNWEVATGDPIGERLATLSP